MALIISMKNKWLQSVLVLLCLLLHSPLTFAQTYERCDAYVKSSLQQHRENVVNACSFGGSRWNSNAVGQKKWCLGTSEKLISSETAERSSSLKVCKHNIQKQGKPYYEAKEYCLPKSFRQIKNNNTKALYHCLRVSKETVQGRKGSYQYLSYLHDFTEGYYFLNFLIEDNSIRLQKHWVGNSGSYCDKEGHGSNDSFALSRFKTGIRISQRCDNKRYSAHDGSVISNAGGWDSSSYRTVDLAMYKGAWHPVHESYSKNWRHNDDGSGHNEKYVNNWRASTYYRYKEKKFMTGRVTLSSLDMEISAGELLTKADTLGIVELFPRSKKALSTLEDVGAFCHVASEQEYEDNNGCAKVSAIKSKINEKGSLYYGTVSGY